MQLKASVAMAALAIGVASAAAAGAQTCSCRTSTAHRSTQHAPNRTVIVEDYYTHAPRRPAPQPYPPPEAYSPPSADIYYDQPGDYYAPYLASYGYGGYVGYGGYGGYGYRGDARPVSGWYSHVGGGARWGGVHGVGGPVAIGRGPGVRRVAGGVGAARVGGNFGGARFGGHAMGGGGRGGGGGRR